jgi:hypothetical protein
LPISPKKPDGRSRSPRPRPRSQRRRRRRRRGGRKPGVRDGKDVSRNDASRTRCRSCPSRSRNGSGHQAVRGSRPQSKLASGAERTTSRLTLKRQRRAKPFAAASAKREFSHLNANRFQPLQTDANARTIAFDVEKSRKFEQISIGANCAWHSRG